MKKFAVLDEKQILKQFSIKNYKDIVQEQCDDGLLLKAMPVFKAGNHRGFDYSEKWLDKFLIGQFDASEDIPIQRDHSDESYATLGYVKNLYRKGDMVYADMLLIDETAISRWKNGLMKKWSIGISREFKLSEISAVAFPYIKEARVHSDKQKETSSAISIIPQATGFSLTVLNASDLGESDSFSTYTDALTSLTKSDNTTIYSVSGPNLFSVTNVDGVLNITQEGDLKMDLEQLKKEKEALELQLKEMKDSIKTKDDAFRAKEEELKKKDADILVYKKAEEDAKFAAIKTSVESEVKELLKEGKVAPAREKSLVDTLCKLSEDARKEMIQTFKESGKIAELDEHGHVKVTKNVTSDFKDGEGKFEFDGKVYDLNVMPAEEINDLASKYAKKNDLGWKESMDIIYSKARPNA